MALNTEQDIKDAVVDWLNRSGSTAVVNRVDDFITMASQRINRKLQLSEQEIAKDINVTGRSYDGLTNLASLIAVVDKNGNALAPVTMQEIFSYTESGTPTRYAVSSNKVFFAPAPSSSETLTVVYRQMNMSLTNFNSTGYVALPDILLNGALMEAHVYLKDDARVAYFKQIFDEGIADAQRDLFTQGLGRGRIKDESIQQYGGPLV